MEIVCFIGGGLLEIKKIKKEIYVDVRKNVYSKLQKVIYEYLRVLE